MILTKVGKGRRAPMCTVSEEVRQGQKVINNAQTILNCLHTCTLNCSNGCSHSIYFVASVDFGGVLHYLP